MYKFSGIHVIVPSGITGIVILCSLTGRWQIPVYCGPDEIHPFVLIFSYL